MLSDVMERSGEASAGRLGDLYRAHADGAVRLAYLLTGDRALAEDLVQDAFVRLAGRSTRMRPRARRRWTTEKIFGALWASCPHASEQPSSFVTTRISRNERS